MPPPLAERLLCSIEEERSCLGAALMNARQAEELVRTARLEFFTFEPHLLIFKAMLRLRPPFEPGLLAGELDRAGLLERAGGVSYLLDLDLGVVVENSMTLRVERLLELWRARELRCLAPEIENRVSLPLAKSAEVIDWIAQRLGEIRTP
jgi:replicative DNA helicase